MNEPKIIELRYKPTSGSPWAALRVGMTRAEARAALGPGPSRELSLRAKRGQIVFDPPLLAKGREVKPQPPKTPPKRVKYVNRDAPELRPCLCCRQSFESVGPGNRMCPQCRTRSVSPFAV